MPPLGRSPSGSIHLEGYKNVRPVLDADNGAVRGKASDSQDSIPDGQNCVFNRQAAEQALVDQGQVQHPQDFNDGFIDGLDGQNRIRSPGPLRHQENLSLAGGTPRQGEQFLAEGREGKTPGKRTSGGHPRAAVRWGNLPPWHLPCYHPQAILSRDFWELEKCHSIWDGQLTNKFF